MYQANLYCDHSKPVSYTHLDVYKRQEYTSTITFAIYICVSHRWTSKQIVLVINIRETIYGLNNIKYMIYFLHLSR